jgi:glycerol-3-phosphate acyltransferase PlsX
LVGDRERVQAELDRQRAPCPRIEIVHADEVVEMDDPPITPIRKKRRSSMRICAQLGKAGRAQAMVTAGNPGAAMIVAKMVIGAIDGVDRPALAAVLPNASGRTVVLDVGANLDSKPEHLRQFAVMGHFYAQEVLGNASPRVGLLSVGEEEVKGTGLTKEVLRVLKTTGLNFIGNVEGGDFFNGKADVVVCDGFVGNAVLKAAESMALLFGKMLRQSLARSTRTKVGAALISRLSTSCGASSITPNTAPRRCSACAAAASSATGAPIRAPSQRRAPRVDPSAADLHHKIHDKVAELHAREAQYLGAGGRA